MLNAEYFQKESRRLSKKLMVWVNYTHIVNRVYIEVFVKNSKKHNISLDSKTPLYFKILKSFNYSEILD